MEKSNNTGAGSKLGAIFRGEALLRNTVDPEGLLERCTLDKLVVVTHPYMWKARFTLPDEGYVQVSGPIIELNVPIIETLIVVKGKDNVREIPVMPAKRLILALENKKGIPAPVRPFVNEKRLLEAKSKGAPAAPFLSDYIELTRDGLMWNIERHKDGHNDEFNQFKYTFEHDSAGRLTKVSFSMSDVMEEGKIVIEADADFKGLGGKKVTLVKNLGMGRTAVVDCKARSGDKFISSLQAAFDLYEVIPVMYTDEIVNNVRKKAPKGMRK